MNVLLDTNVILDVLLEREPWLADSQRVWQACDDGRVIGYVVASTLTDIYYIARKVVGNDKAREAVEICLATFLICPVDRIVLEQALLLPGDDFEDNVQLAAAMQSRLNAIVTRNPDDLGQTAMTVFTPPALLSQLPVQ